MNKICIFQDDALKTALHYHKGYDQNLAIPVIKSKTSNLFPLNAILTLYAFKYSGYVQYCDDFICNAVDFRKPMLTFFDFGY